ncbi:MAG: peptide chain release factor-like protein [Candidatus Omnitrophica bacterium]|nr:peptide chain release factor-like protein [Candidatus Omnitrophota bacterium]
MSLYPVSCEKEKQLLERMRKWNVLESDIRETFVRAQGRGGQKVNKTSSCVMLVHIPTGISVKCQTERSQAMNRFIARRLLLAKIEERELGRLSTERQRREKIRRQKKRRSRRGKEKMLKEKHERGEIKEMRRLPKPDSE